MIDVPSILAMLQNQGTTIPPPPFPSMMAPGTTPDPTGTNVPDGADDEDDEEELAKKKAALATIAQGAAGSAAPLPLTPPATTQAPTPAPALAPAGTTPAAPAPAAAAQTPEEKKGIWASFLGHLHDNPDLTQSLLHFAAAAAAPPKPGQNTLSVLSSALSGAGDYYTGRKSAETEQERQEALLREEQKRTGIEQQNADTTANKAKWDKEAGEARLAIDSGTAKSDEDLKAAQTKYYNAMALSEGKSVSDSGAKLQLADKMAKAAVATGMFKDENQATLWATDSVLHTQGETPQQLLQSMMKTAFDNVTKLPDATPESIQAAMKAAQGAWQYMNDNKLLEQTPQPGPPAAGAPVAAPAPGGVAPASAPTPTPAAPPVTTPALQAQYAKAVPSYAAAGYKLGNYVAGKGYQLLDPQGKPLNTFWSPPTS